MASDTIVIKFDGDIKSLKTKLATTDKKISKLKTGAAGVGKALKSAGKVAAVGFAVLTGAISASIAMFREQEQAEIRTRKTIEATGGAAGLAAEEIFKMAAELQKVTTYGDETIIAGQNMLLTFRNIGEDVFPRATEAMLDMSTAMGTDLKSSAIQLGKALNAPTVGMASLARVGITFTDSQKDQIKTMEESGDLAGAQTVILKELENQFGGVSRAATEGTGGLIQTKNALGDIAEEIGRAVLPAILSLNNALLVVLNDSNNIVNRTIKGIGDAIEQEFEIGGVKTMTRLVEVNAELEKIGANIKGTKKSISGDGAWWTAIVPDEMMNERLKLNLEKQAELIKEQNQLKKDIAGRGAQDETAARLEKLRAGLKEEQDLKVEAALTETELLNEISAEQFSEEYETRRERLEQLDALVQENIIKGYDAGRAVAKADLKASIKENKLKATEELKYGKGIATMKAFFRDEEVKGTMQGLAMIAALQNSGSKRLMRIGKAAAMAMAVMNTAQGITNALANVPQPLTFAAAAAVGVAGAAQIATIASTGFAKGGIVEGGVAGKDSVPIMAMGGELMTPRSNFDEVIGSVRAQREAETIMEDSSASYSTAIEISFKDDIGEFIEANILERRTLGIGAI